MRAAADRLTTVGTRDDQFWAEFLGIAPVDWSMPGVSVRPHVGLSGYCGLWCFRHQDRTVVSVPRGWVDYLETRLKGCEPDHLLEEAFLVELLGGEFERLIGPAFQGCLDPGRFRPASSADVRFVGPNDAAAVDQFRAECGPGGWETGGLDEVKHHVAAYFQGERLVAMAGYRPWTDFAGDPCVLTHPGFRGRGCGNAVVSAVIEQALQRGQLLLYQTLEANRSAVKIALKLGYEQYGRHVAVRLKGERPSNLPLRRA